MSQTVAIWKIETKSPAWAQEVEESNSISGGETVRNFATKQVHNSKWDLVRTSC
jgi:hypothetical protein